MSSKTEFSKTWPSRNRALGLCTRCSSKRLLNSNSFCEKHYLQDCSHKNLGSKKDWLFLKDLLIRQNFECYYSGVKLILGVNASIDHIKSKVLFPELAKNKDNIRWVDIKVNRMKREMLEEDFIELCRKISIKNTTS